MIVSHRALPYRHGDQTRDRKEDSTVFGAAGIRGRIARSRFRVRALRSQRRLCVQDITKQIVNRIEKTMASRAATDGAGLSMVKDDGALHQPRCIGEAGMLWLHVYLQHAIPQRLTGVRWPAAQAKRAGGKPC